MHKVGMKTGIQCYITHLVVAFGVLFGIFYGFLVPEKFDNKQMKATTLIINPSTTPITEKDIEASLGVKKNENEEDEDLPENDDDETFKVY
jgi:hypothetical protein